MTQDRSRSPKRGTSWISRAISSFGRYPEKRPRGLCADETGAFPLEQLMVHWGREHGLKEQDVLEALREHMFADQDGKDGHLRFVIDADQMGNIIVRVPPKRFRRPRTTAPSDQATSEAPVKMATDSPRLEPAKPKSTKEKLSMSLGDLISTDRDAEARVRVSRDDKAREDFREARLVQEQTARPLNFSVYRDPDPSRPVHPSLRNTNYRAYGMPAPRMVPVVTMVPETVATSTPVSLTPSSQYGILRAERVKHRFQQMGLTNSTSHIREAARPTTRDARDGRARRERHERREDQVAGPQKPTVIDLEGDENADVSVDGARPVDAERAERARRREGRSTIEHIQRWIGWVLKKGHTELNLAVADGGWVQLEGLAKAISGQRPDLGDFDAGTLQTILEANNNVGRFEIAGGRLRKVPHGERRRTQHAPRTTNSSSAQPTDLQDKIRAVERRGLSPDSSDSSERGGVPSRSASRSRSRSPAMVTGEEDSALAQRCATSLHVAGDVDILDAGEAAAYLEPDQMPAVPPGEHWTKYIDDDLLWWHYDGPLGQWWCSPDTDNKVVRYSGG